MSPLQAALQAAGNQRFYLVLEVSTEVSRQVLGLGNRLHQEHLRNKKGGRCGEQVMRSLGKLLFLNCLHSKKEVGMAGFSCYSVTPLPENCCSTSFTTGHKRLAEGFFKGFDWLPRAACETAAE
jgi:hypothetical protein